MSWNSGDEERLPRLSHTNRNTSNTAFLPEGDYIEFENRVDLANGSKPAIDLLEEPRGWERINQRLRRLSYRSRRHSAVQTPWEGKEYWEADPR